MTASRSYDGHLIDLRNTLGGKIIQRPARGRDQSIWVWGVSGKRAAGIMLTLYPFMSARRQRQIDKSFRMPAERGKCFINGELIWARTLARKEECKKGHLFSKENTYYFKGRRSCRACRNLWPVQARRRRREQSLANGRPLRTTTTRSIEEMRRIAKQHGGECLATSYVNNYTKMRWRCVQGHEWDCLPKSVLQGTWCAKCAARRKKR